MEPTQEKPLAVWLEVNPAARSVVRFTVQGDPWPTIAAWAQRHKYLPRAPQTGDVKMFQKGSGLWTAPMRAQFSKRGDQIELQAWVHNPLFARIMSLVPIFEYNTVTEELDPFTPAPVVDPQFIENPTLPELTFRRCPGAATQPAPDLSNPFLDLGNLSSGPPPADCNATQVPPGP